jgi:conjugative relaxase-like TrwC/TraI family protein
VAIGLQKLSAGSGYEYLIRQVAASDATGRGHTTLADYYSVKGEAPGHWYGGGLAGVGLAPGDAVTSKQMKLLFGGGLDPVTGEKLGRRYAVYGIEPTPFQAELARRIEAWQGDDDTPIPQQVRDRLRTELARERFSREYGREPSGPRELHGFIVKSTSHPRTSVAGFDLTFTPPKSVSALWAVAGPELAAAIRAAHVAAVGDAMTAAERRVIFTRQGHEGARHVEVRGLLAAAFVHRDSRAGDPNLHTHVAIANKVQTLAGDWLAIDAQLLYRSKVSLSEEYTTSLQARLSQLRLSFVATGPDGKRPVYEIVGVDPRLLARWSSRRHQVTARTTDLVAQFEADHERPPTPSEKLDLAQRATLETRQAKHQPRSEAEQRAAWRRQAEHVLGTGELVRMLSAVVSERKPRSPVIDDAFVATTAQHVIRVVESERSSWTAFHLRAEALRQVRAAELALNDIDQAVGRIVGHGLSPELSTAVTTTWVMPVEPPALRRRDGESVYAEPAATHYTSRRVLQAEQRLVDRAGETGGRTVAGNTVTFALLQSMANHEPLNPGQRLLVQEMAMSGRRLQLAIAPAGTGKTTAMRALASAWTTSGGTVLGLAPSATAAEELRAQLDTDKGATVGVVADNLAKLVWAIDHKEPLANAVGPDTLVIIDEASMADTVTLDRVVTWCCDRGASVRLVGDDQQLGAIGAGGVLRDIAGVHGAVRLDDVVRFTDPAEAEASLALRAGDVGSLGFYLDNNRVHVVDPDTATAALVAAWQADTQGGLDAIMLAPTRSQVAELNYAARAIRLEGATPDREAILADGNHASRGDVIITRRNNRALTSGATAWVRNGDRWRITRLHRDGALDVQNLRSRARLTLPAEYVSASVELGYATTIHGAQGVTADTCHGLLSGTESRQQAYTMLTRGRSSNHAWVLVSDVDHHTVPVAQKLIAPSTATQLLESIIQRDDGPVSATTLLARADDPVQLLGPAVTCLFDAVGFAVDRTLDQATKDVIDIAGKSHGLTDSDAWPTLRDHLMLIAAHGHDPAVTLTNAAALGSLETARDPAAVIDHRLDLTKGKGLPLVGLPWTPNIPDQLLDNPEWGPYLQARKNLVRDLTMEVLRTPYEEMPAWARDTPGLSQSTLYRFRLWRGAHSIPDTDLRPTGPPRYTAAEREEQASLDSYLESRRDRLQDWIPRIVDAVPGLAGDPRLVAVAAQLDALRSPWDAEAVLHKVAGSGPLPDDHPADALIYRITHLIKVADARESELKKARRPDPHAPKPPEHSRHIGR